MDGPDDTKNPALAWPVMSRATTAEAASNLFFVMGSYLPTLPANHFGPPLMSHRAPLFMPPATCDMSSSDNSSSLLLSVKALLSFSGIRNIPPNVWDFMYYIMLEHVQQQRNKDKELPADSVSLQEVQDVYASSQ